MPTLEHLTVSSYNVQNLDPGDGWSRFLGIGSQIAQPLAGPDIVALQEVQDASGPIDDGITDAGETYRMLIDAIASAGGPRYEFADVAPPDGRDGGQPGGNIRVGYLYNPERVQVVEGSKQRLLDGVGDDAFSSFERFRQRVENEEAEAEAHQEMAGPGPSLDEEIGKLERRNTVEDELKALKQRLGKDDA